MFGIHTEMETTDLVNATVALIDSLGTIGILIWAWHQERQRADILTSYLIDDWKRQNDREPVNQNNAQN